MPELEVLNPEIMKVKYLILRRALTDKTYSPLQLKDLCFSLEGKTIEALKHIHLTWIGPGPQRGSSEKTESFSPVTGPSGANRPPSLAY